MCATCWTTSASDQNGAGAVHTDFRIVRLLAERTPLYQPAESEFCLAVVEWLGMILVDLGMRPAPSKLR